MIRIYLTGFMGCGKSTVGRALAEALGVQFVDLDERVAQSLGASIPEIFARQGEPAFRSEETRQLRATGSLERVVVATGGGTYCSEVNRRLIRESDGVAVFLELPWEVLLSRLPGRNADRPKFRDPTAARQLYELRLSDYRKADVLLRLDGSESVDRVARRILSQVEGIPCGT